MARIFLDDLRSNINSLITNNTSGDISGADLNGILTDITDSVVTDEATLLNFNTTPTLDLTGTWEDMLAFDLTVGESSPFLIFDSDSGDQEFDPTRNNWIQTSATPGYTYSIFWQAIIEAAATEQVELGISSSAVGGQWGTTTIIQGNGTTPVSGMGFMPINANTADDRFGMVARCLDGAATVKFDSLLMQLRIQPTNNP